MAGHGIYNNNPPVLVIPALTCAPRAHGGCGLAEGSKCMGGVISARWTTSS